MSSDIAVEDRLFRALAVLRVVLLGNALGLNIFRYDNFQHPGLGVGVLAAMLVWTVLVIWRFSEHTRRTPLWLGLDLAVALAALISTPFVKTEWFNASIPGFWIAGALLAWAVHWRMLGGLVAATLLCATDLLLRQEISQTNYGHIFLLMIAGPIVGFLCGSLQRMARERDAAERAAAIAGERERLARAVHDGVLQVLALVQRKGAELGGEGATLGRLAGEQENALRSLIRQQATLDTTDAPTDLTGELERIGLARPPTTSVVTPGTTIELPADTVAEIVAVVQACLDNVVVHVGEDARAWVLLEDLGDAVAVTVRDEGPGIADGRLEEARRAGRLGVASSIRGRITDLGGRAELFTGAGQGTEWEFTIPRPD
ncbi:signal transduction histidine kinase [Nocardioides daedukensis]|uniref:Signal transduction histidine kinase n=1 Tax=Nocardioides daedukensis TaxID=634462 RepID=A0A7Y9UP99_9ACTN|nr:signal transduction histidine kinase [Nocardioides daedukensis]